MEKLPEKLAGTWAWFTQLGPQEATIYAKVWEFIQSYQSLLGGSLAFFGVILTIWSNGRRLREQLKHNSEADALRHLREQDQKRKSVREALLAEIAMIARFFKDEYEQAQKWRDPRWRSNEEQMKEGDWDVWDNAILADTETYPSIKIEESPYRFAFPDRDNVYRALVGQIYALERDEVANVISAYDLYNTFKSWIQEHDMLDGTVPHVASISPDDIDKLIAVIDATNKDFDRLVSRLS